MCSVVVVVVVLASAVCGVCPASLRSDALWDNPVFPWHFCLASVGAGSPGGDVYCNKLCEYLQALPAVIAPSSLPLHPPPHPNGRRGWQEGLTSLLRITSQWHYISIERKLSCVYTSASAFPSFAASTGALSPPPRLGWSRSTFGQHQGGPLTF